MAFGRELSPPSPAPLSPARWDGLFSPSPASLLPAGTFGKEAAPAASWKAFWGVCFTRAVAQP